jgi:hypothetical protein
MPDSIKTIQNLKLSSKIRLLMKNSNSFSTLIWANKSKSDVNGMMPLRESYCYGQKSRDFAVFGTSCFLGNGVGKQLLTTALAHCWKKQFNNV